jgi:ketosteroid isomerase-like protein
MRCAAAFVALCVWAAPAGAQSIAEQEAQVRAAETAFAKTMADRDHAAFVSFLAEDTVFFGGQGPIRGRDAVAAAWKRFYEGPQAPFSWGPERVAVIATGGLAYSSGPVKDPAGKNVGTYNSTWRREQDGSWKIVLDAGCPACNCAPAAPAPSPAASPAQP